MSRGVCSHTIPRGTNIDITLPFNYKPRDYQVPVLKALDGGTNRAVWIVHRRGGKDKTAINLVSKKMFERVGGYYYFFPTYNQGRKILWNGIDRDGFRFLDHIPKELRTRTDNTEMLIETINGSIFQVIGTDNIDRVVGTNPVGCVFSEYALQDPKAWGLIRPILAENGGWALFVYTPRGDNHGKTLVQNAKKWPGWFVEILTAKDTNVFNNDQLDRERLEIIAEYGEAEGQALFDQEYMCSFDAPVLGSYYGAQMQKAEVEGRITRVPHEPSLPVHTFWDLGVGDATAIGFFQIVGAENRVIDYYEAEGEGLPHYVSVLQEKREKLGYNYGEHYAPHDIQVRELSSGKSRYETAQKLGISFSIVPNLPVDDGIDAARSLLNTTWFDSEKCEYLISALKNYHKEFDDKRKQYKSKPYHDWSSHAADMFRYRAVGYRPVGDYDELPQDDDPFDL